MSEDYIERVKKIVTINPPHSSAEKDIWEILDTSKAVIFDGHFELLSGRHSDKFFRFAAITQFPYFVSKISKEMVKWLKGNEIPGKIDVVLSPSSQGLFFAYDISRELNGAMKTRAVYAAIDKKTGYPKEEFVEGFEIKSGENVLVVNDMTTTGSGIESLIKLAERSSAKVVGICLFANRGIDEPKVTNIKSKYLFHSIIDLKMPSWSSKECKDRCLDDKKLIKATKLNHLPIYSVENAYEKYVEKLEVVAS
jgi:orotate phosphoribosyltransferase